MLNSGLIKSLIFSIIFQLFVSHSVASAPSLTIISPQDGTFVSQTVLIGTQLTTIPKVKFVKFYIDNTLVGESTTSPYQYIWDTTTYADGQHQIYASISQVPKHLGPFNNENHPVLDSSKITVTIDNTPPTTPTVTDDGIYTTSLAELHATWTESTDSESGVYGYQYSIGTSIGITDIVDWTSSGTNAGITYTDLTLSQGQPYYFNVKAINGSGLESGEGHTDGIIANDETTLLINITSPEDNALFNVSPIIVEGTVSHNSAEVKVNGLSINVVDNTFGIPVVITEGLNFVTAKAVLGEQTTQERINVCLDLTPPKVSVITPDENATTGSNIIYGQVSEDTFSVMVNDVQAELVGDCFIVLAFLEEGMNTITVEAQDQAGNIIQKTHTFALDTTTPKVIITNPAHNATINLSPITVTGAVTSDISYIFVETSTGIIEDTNFTANYIRLNSTKSVITATGYDEASQKHQDAIIINTPDLKHYELTNVFGNIQEYEEAIPEAGSDWNLTTKLYISDTPAVSEEVEFSITQGSGVLSSQYVWTDIDGLAAVTLATDQDSSITNKAEAKSSTHPDVKITFSVDTKPAQPALLTKITDETQTPIPGAVIPLIVKLTDQYENPIPGEGIEFYIIQGTGVLSDNSAITNSYGGAKIDLTCPDTGSTLIQITGSSTAEPSVTITFNITTSEPLIITIDDIINKINANNEKIQDVKADITVTSTAPFLPEESQLKIWQKGDKQKVEEISPEPQVKIRPPVENSIDYVEIGREIISHDPATNIYTIKTKRQGQTEEYPYQILYIDYNKGVELKSEYYTKDSDLEMIFTTEAQDFIQLGDAWVFQKLIEIAYEGQD
ncbi:MAG: hypothetical protein KAQ99_02720, partial [Candidatus Aureabacteria bacterium]|nr:hypothetical protein [Candidatus Auribacterota bacterium]